MNGLVAWAAVGVSMLAVVGCSCGDGEGALDGAVGLDGEVPSLDASSLDGSLVRTDGGARDASGDERDATVGSPEVCDGVDNDGNGIIDDVDVEGDGVCDCLLVATLGEAGEWGEGDVFASWLDARSDTGATDLGSMELTPERLEPYQVIIVQDVRARAYSDDEIAALRAWVEAGGGLMTLIGYGDADERTNVNALLAPSGLSYDAAPILAGTPTVPVTEWRTHPVSEMVTQVGVDNGYEVIGGGDVVAEEGGFVLLRATALGEGKVLAWGDEWITYDSEWLEHPEYQLERFWLNAIKWLTPATECQVPILI